MSNVIVEELFKIIDNEGIDFADFNTYEFFKQKRAYAANTRHIEITSNVEVDKIEGLEQIYEAKLDVTETIKVYCKNTNSIKNIPVELINFTICENEQSYKNSKKDSELKKLYFNNKNNESENIEDLFKIDEEDDEGI